MSNKKSNSSSSGAIVNICFAMLMELTNSFELLINGTFSQNGDEVNPLTKVELKPLSGYKSVTLSPLNESSF